jgi:predicted RNA-binding protein YlqC (UPF0109 family)
MDRVEEIRSALETFARAMVCHKKALRVTFERRGPEVFYRIEAAQADLRYLIGSKGSNFDALSTLVWSMGNVEPRIQTRLLRLADKPVTYQPEATGAVDPSDVLRGLLLDVGLPNLASVKGAQVRMLLERAGDGAEELRAYLLGMRVDDLSTEARAALRARK